MKRWLGQYELIARVGAGGMGEVYRARTYGPEGFCRDLCIKMMLPRRARNREFVSMFLNEARLAARLRHANIVPIYGLERIDDSYVIVMEWIDGSDLRTISKRAQKRSLSVPLSFVVHVAGETLKALHYAHTLVIAGCRHNVVHRDVSPQNVLVSFAGEVKLTDFGIAKANEIPANTRRGIIKGKTPYMSPEQASGSVVDGRSDLYSLGVLLWELAAGRRWFPAALDRSELLRRVSQGEIPPLCFVSPAVDENVDAFIARLLAPDPGARYDSAAEALRAVSTLSRADDSLGASAFLRRLMPVEAGHAFRGRTQVLMPACQRDAFTEAPPNAKTRSLTPWPTPSIGTRKTNENFVPSAEEAHPLPPDGVTAPQSVSGTVRWCIIAIFAFAVGSQSAGPAGECGGVAHETRSKKPQAALPSGFASHLDPCSGGLDPARLPTDPQPVCRAATYGRESHAAEDPRGVIDILVHPWARVRVDGTWLDHSTPIREHRLAPGRHRVELQNGPLERYERIDLDLDKGEKIQIRRFWSDVGRGDRALSWLVAPTHPVE